MKLPIKWRYKRAVGEVEIFDCTLIEWLKTLQEPCELGVRMIKHYDTDGKLLKTDIMELSILPPREDSKYITKMTPL